MAIAKEMVRQALESLPDPLEIEDLLYQLELFTQIEASERAVEEGRILTHEEAKRRVQSWQR